MATLFMERDIHGKTMVGWLMIQGIIAFAIQEFWYYLLSG